MKRDARKRREARKQKPTAGSPQREQEMGALLAEPRLGWGHSEPALWWFHNWWEDQGSHGAHRKPKQ